LLDSLFEDLGSRTDFSTLELEHIIKATTNRGDVAAVLGTALPIDIRRMILSKFKEEVPGEDTPKEEVEEPADEVDEKTEVLQKIYDVLVTLGKGDTFTVTDVTRAMLALDHLSKTDANYPSAAQMSSVVGDFRALIKKDLSALKKSGGLVENEPLDVEIPEFTTRVRKVVQPTPAPIEEEEVEEVPAREETLSELFGKLESKIQVGVSRFIDLKAALLGESDASRRDWLSESYSKSSNGLFAVQWLIRDFNNTVNQFIKADLEGNTSLKAPFKYKRVLAVSNKERFARRASAFFDDLITTLIFTEWNELPKEIQTLTESIGKKNANFLQSFTGSLNPSEARLTETLENVSKEYIGAKTLDKAVRDAATETKFNKRVLSVICFAPIFVENSVFFQSLGERSQTILNQIMERANEQKAKRKDIDAALDEVLDVLREDPSKQISGTSIGDIVRDWVKNEPERGYERVTDYYNKAGAHNVGQVAIAAKDRHKSRGFEVFDKGHAQINATTLEGAVNKSRDMLAGLLDKLNKADVKVKDLSAVDLESFFEEEAIDLELFYKALGSSSPDSILSIVKQFALEQEAAKQLKRELEKLLLALTKKKYQINALQPGDIQKFLTEGGFNPLGLYTALGRKDSDVILTSLKDHIAEKEGKKRAFKPKLVAKLKVEESEAEEDIPKQNIEILIKLNEEQEIMDQKESFIDDLFDLWLSDPRKLPKALKGYSNEEIEILRDDAVDYFAKQEGSGGSGGGGRTYGSLGPPVHSFTRSVSGSSEPTGRRQRSRRRKSKDKEEDGSVNFGTMDDDADETKDVSEGYGDKVFYAKGGKGAAAPEGTSEEEPLEPPKSTVKKVVKGSKPVKTRKKKVAKETASSDEENDES
ncbi:MAG: hypothetical protein GOV15_01455, partial [Candidatus Diapherotrites archaeon]|nr:hypothetical protein [Candidatus Diapherotrites archaeon]